MLCKNTEYGFDEDTMVTVYDNTSTIQHTQIMLTVIFHITQVASLLCDQWACVGYKSTAMAYAIQM